MTKLQLRESLVRPRGLIALLFLIAMLMGTSLLAQNPSGVPDTVWQPLFVRPPATSGGISQVVPTSAGLGQHRLTVYLANAPTHTCSSQTVDIFFQASSDGVNYFEIGSPISSIIADAFGNLTGVTEAAGSYPFIRVYLRSFDFVNCTLTAFYAGSKFTNPEAVAVLPKAQARNMIQRAFSFNAATDNVAILPLNSSRYTCIYGLEVTNAGNATNVFTLKTGPPGGPYGSIFIRTLNAAGTAPDSFSIGPSPLAIYCNSRGNSIVFGLSSTSVVNGFMQYRYEDNPQ